MSVYCTPETCATLLGLKLFKGLGESELLSLLAHAELIECYKGDYLIREGEQGNELFVLLNGQVAISMRTATISKVIQELGPGECFGEMSLIDCRSRSASVKALSNGKLLKLEGDQLSENPVISAKLYRNIAILLSQRLRHANEILVLG